MRSEGEEVAGASRQGAEAPEDEVLWVPASGDGVAEEEPWRASAAGVTESQGVTEAGQGPSEYLQETVAEN